MTLRFAFSHDFYAEALAEWTTAFAGVTKKGEGWIFFTRPFAGMTEEIGDFLQPVGADPSLTESAPSPSGV